MRALAGMLALLLATTVADSGFGQTPPPDMPRNVLAPLVPYEQGMADIQRRDALRDKAVVPRTRPDQKPRPLPSAEILGIQPSPAPKAGPRQ